MNKRKEGFLGNAIDRKQGDQIDTLTERHGVAEKTIRNWLDRFAEQPIEQAPYDAPRPGGPSKLTAEQRERLFEVLQDPPAELGYETTGLISETPRPPCRPRV